MVKKIIDKKSKKIEETLMKVGVEISKKGEDYVDVIKEKFDEFLESLSEKYDKVKDEVCDIAEQAKDKADEVKVNIRAPLWG